MKSVLLEALQRDPAQRDSFVRSHPELDPTQVEEILQLLNARDAQPAFLDTTLPGILTVSKPIVSPGDTISGRYLIKEALYLQPDSQVYLASDLRLASYQVVVKFPIQGRENIAAIQDKLWTEIESLARLNQSGISGLIDTGTYNNQPFLVMQYYKGPTLDRWLHESRPDKEARLQIFLTLLRVVERIHKAGLIHLDLKPQNIIVSADSDSPLSITILDFGVASLIEYSNVHKAGTPAYAAPERASGFSAPSSDVYSLGRIALDLLAPLSGPPARVVHRALSLDPLSRPQSAIEFLHLMDQALRSQKRQRLILKSLIPTAVIVLLLFFALRWMGTAPVPSLPKAHEITKMRGIEMDPAFSPDGETVYFSHSPAPNISHGIYSIPFHGGQHKLVIAPSNLNRYTFPQASPDGKHLAFLEDNTDGTSSIIYAALDASSKQRLFTGLPQSLSFSPSGEEIYFTHVTQQFPRGKAMRLALGSNKVESLPEPPNGYLGDTDISISPDGRFAAFVRFRSLECADVFLLPLNQTGQSAAPSYKVTDLDRRVRRPQWLSNSKNLVFTAGSLSNLSLYKIEFSRQPGQSAKVLAMPGWGDRIGDPAAARFANRIAFVKDHDECDIYSLNLTGKPFLERIIASTALDEEPRYSFDGKNIAFYSERDGTLQGYVAPRTAPGAATVITNFERAEKAWPAWTPSGSAFFFARIPGLGPELVKFQFPKNASTRRVFSAEFSQRIAGMGVDGESLIAEPTPGVQTKLERWSLVTGQHESLGTAAARYAREFYRNGLSGPRLILYAEPHEINGLFLLENGVSRKIYPNVFRRNTFTYLNGFAYLTSTYPQLGVYKVNINTGASTLLLPLDKKPGWGMDISPDGRELLIALYDFEDSNLQGVELP